MNRSKTREYFRENYQKNILKRRQKAREKYWLQRDVLIERQKQWYKNNLEKVKKYRRSKHYKNLCKIQNVKRRRYAKDFWLKRQFGITIEEYEERFSKQNGKCAICIKSETQNGRWGIISLSVDHCHNSKKVRGLLCHKCNSGLGYFQDNPERMEAAAMYIRNSLE